MVICLERGADLHMAQLMPLPLSVSCFSQIGFTFLVPAHPGSPVCVCVCVHACVCARVCVCVCVCLEDISMWTYSIHILLCKLLILYRMMKVSQNMYMLH